MSDLNSPQLFAHAFEAMVDVGAGPYRISRSMLRRPSKTFKPLEDVVFDGMLFSQHDLAEIIKEPTAPRTSAKHELHTNPTCLTEKHIQEDDEDEDFLEKKGPRSKQHLLLPLLLP